MPSSEELDRLRRLWDDHSHQPFPSAAPDGAAQQEVALYNAWLASIVVAVLKRGGVGVEHEKMLSVRRREGNRELFRAAGEMGDPMRSYVARLIAMEEILHGLEVRV